MSPNAPGAQKSDQVLSTTLSEPDADNNNVQLTTEGPSENSEEVPEALQISRSISEKAVMSAVEDLPQLKLPVASSLQLFAPHQTQTTSQPSGIMAHQMFEQIINPER